MSSSNPDANPCLTCGACCAAFRVSFYCGELDDRPGGRVPTALTTQIAPLLAAMRGTSAAPVRCVALEGAVGGPVRCTIYERRPSCCREVGPRAHLGVGDERCTQARVRWGLAPLPESGAAESSPRSAPGEG